MSDYKTILTKQLIKDEGIELFPYMCSEKKLTIGVGRNLESNGISEAEAMLLIENDIDRCVIQLKSKLPYYFILPENVKIVLLNMCFNMGVNGLLKFKKTLKYIENKEYKEASIEMLDSKWAKQVGRRAKRLSKQLAAS